MNRPQTILVIDDDPMIHKLLPVRLKELNVQLLHAQDGEEGLAMANAHTPDLILLDVMMPRLDGFEVCRQLQHGVRTREVPVIFLTGSDNANEMSRGFELGAMDYVTKPFNANELRARVRSALRLQALVAALETQAKTDALTGLPNRSAFKHRLQRVFDRSRSQGTSFALVFIDLDRFKHVNDSLGHAAGDRLLVQVADVLQHEVAAAAKAAGRLASDFIARMGGDEFVVIVDSNEDVHTLMALGERLRAALGVGFPIDGHHVHVGARLGIRICSDWDATPEDLVRDSDTAMYAAKEQGKGRCVLFTEQMHLDARERVRIEEELQVALSNGQLWVAYQPIVDINTAQIAGFEALMRWHHPQRGNIVPDQFIPIAEESGLVVPIGRWVLEESCRQFVAWREQGLISDAQHISVNLSKAQIMHPDIEAHIVVACETAGLPFGQLHLEVTESVIMHEVNYIVQVLNRLRALGICISMDDFGTGYSSLASLHRFPIDTLKIDRQFTETIANSRQYAAVIQAIIMLADNLGMRVVAEGIESSEQLTLLQALSCGFGQGYHLGRPTTAEATTQLLRDHKDACCNHGTGVLIPIETAPGVWGERNGAVA